MSILTNLEFITEQQQISTYFGSEDLPIVSELVSFAQKMQLLKAELSSDYKNFLLNLIVSVDINHDESFILEQIIPQWAKSRGQDVPADKSVDQFYFEFEMLLLWECLLRFVADDKNQVVILKLRNIIRRYSNLPELWQYLCQISGDKVTDAYTF